MIISKQPNILKIVIQYAIYNFILSHKGQTRINLVAVSITFAQPNILRIVELRDYKIKLTVVSFLIKFRIFFYQFSVLITSKQPNILRIVELKDCKMKHTVFSFLHHKVFRNE